MNNNSEGTWDSQQEGGSSFSTPQVVVLVFYLEFVDGIVPVYGLGEESLDSDECLLSDCHEQVEEPLDLDDIPF